MDMESENPNCDYPFSTLDILVEQTFNPHHFNYTSIDDTTISANLLAVQTETDRIYQRLKSQTFFIFNPQKTGQIVNAYLESLALLIKDAKEYLLDLGDNHVQTEATETLIHELDKLRRRIEKRYQQNLISPAAPADNEAPVIHKVLVKLSVDQVAVILKAADDAKLLIARSLSAVFQSIVPYISTEKVKNISWKSARSSTYKFEDRDKMAAIAVLEQLIKRIREY